MAGFNFKPKLSMTLATIIVMTICIKLGFWQYNKAQTKLVLQEQMELGLEVAPVGLPDSIQSKEVWRYKRVKFSGVYASQYQILLDNKVNEGVVGYHVLTPMKIEGAKQEYVLVNRGWVAGNLNRNIPKVTTPEGKQTIQGDIFFPLTKFFTLESPQTSEKWQGVWQHIDMQRYTDAVPFGVVPYVVRLDAQSTGGGFSRNWPLPANRITVHLGYAYQWFGFALTLFVIYIVLNFKKLKKES
jgi:surfeit locus 1 family protein